ncbi:MipA/OmpV family protein [Paraburkholderia aromaticivorans]|uniref:MipA/OmpV family protein n=1 Tax=Paraburkholderia aromaticivorans TaxID=2026199 RepID=UPI0014560A3F|nr:MipA/OmpV family protein [Paraburkholderia aromaticivorans]
MVKLLRHIAAVASVVVLQNAIASPIDLSNALPNFFGGGVGSTTEYAGAKDRIVGAVPGMRYVTNGGHLFEWYGTYAQYDFGSVTGFQWGPALALRLGRHDVDDPVVAQVHSVATTLEGGGFVGYEYSHVGTLPYRLRGEMTVVTNAGVVYTGARVSLNTSAWFPLHARVFVGGGLGATWVSGGFNETYYGVTAQDSAKSGLSAYTPGSGLNQLTSWIAAIYQISPSWYAGAMVYYQRLMDEAANSPIVSQRGSRNQITYGVGLAYAFR